MDSNYSQNEIIICQSYFTDTLSSYSLFRSASLRQFYFTYNWKRYWALKWMYDFKASSFHSYSMHIKYYIARKHYIYLLHKSCDNRTQKSIQYKRMARCDIFITTFQSFLFQYWLGLLTLTRMCSNYNFSSAKNFKCLRHRISIHSICWYVNMCLLHLEIVSVITFDQK